jgi:carbonic anhydrase
MGRMADEVMTALMEGNARHAEGRHENPRRGPGRRREVASAQCPAAAVVCCSDSRVPPEMIFDQGIGDLFVVRTAGNVMDEVGVGSIEYAAEHLGVPLVIVLGHSRCGAVTAAVEGGGARGRVAGIVRAIAPAVDRARKDDAADPVEAAVRINVARTVEALRAAGPVLSRLVEEGRLAVVGACYDLDTGRVELIAQ